MSIVRVKRTLPTGGEWYFTGVETPEEVKARYLEMAKILHPDIGGSTESFQALKTQYDWLQKIPPGGETRRWFVGIDKNAICLTPIEMNENIEFHLKDAELAAFRSRVIKGGIDLSYAEETYYRFLEA